MTANRVIPAVTAILTVALAAAAFVLSFNSLTELAAQQGLSVPVLFPLILEGGLIVFSLTALTRSLNGQSTRYQWALVIASSAAATAFNVLHAPPTWLARVMWAIPSIMLLLSFESWLTQMRHRVRVGEAQKTLTATETQLTELTTTITAQQAEADRLAATIAARRRELADIEQPPIDELTIRRIQAQALERAGLPRTDIADLLQVSPSTIKRDLQTKVNLNGQEGGAA